MFPASLWKPRYSAPIGGNSPHEFPLSLVQVRERRRVVGLFSQSYREVHFRRTNATATWNRLPSASHAATGDTDVFRVRAATNPSDRRRVSTVFTTVRNRQEDKVAIYGLGGQRKMRLFFDLSGQLVVILAAGICSPNVARGNQRVEHQQETSNMPNTARCLQESFGRRLPYIYCGQRRTVIPSRQILGMVLPNRWLPRPTGRPAAYLHSPR